MFLVGEQWIFHRDVLWLACGKSDEIYTISIMKKIQLFGSLVYIQNNFELDERFEEEGISGDDASICSFISVIFDVPHRFHACRF